MRAIKNVAERLIVAADFKPPTQNACAAYGAWVHSRVIALARSLDGTGVVLKVNSALRAYGYDLIDQIHSCGLRVFADLKLYDISETLSTDGILLHEAQPELVTVSALAGVPAMKALKKELPNTEVLGITVLTSLTDADTHAMFVCSVKEAVKKFATFSKEAEVDGLISSPKEAAMLREKFGVLLSINTPAIRPEWAIIKGDDQNPERIMTPAKAIKAGADRIVVGRPIITAQDPYAAAMRTIEEIASVV